MAALLALAAAGVFGGADFLGGYAARSASARAVALLAYLAGMVTAIVALVLFGGVWSSGAITYGVLAGFAGTAGLVLLFTGFARGRFQIVSPAAAVMSGVVPVVWGLLSGEQPGSLTYMGLIIAPVGIWLLAGGTASLPRAEDVRPLLLGLAAGVGFGIFFVCLAQAPDGAGVVPLVMARVASIGALVLVGLLMSGPMLPRSGKLPALASGALDLPANGLFLLAAGSGDLVVVGALVALFPASNALLARIILKERLGWLQRLGFVIAIAAGAALAV